MFDIGLFELLVVGGVGLVVIGPERLPGAIKTGALWVGRVKRSILETRREIEQSIGADEIRRELRNEEIMASLEKLREARTQLEEDIKAHTSGNILDHQDEVHQGDEHGDDSHYHDEHHHDDHHDHHNLDHNANYHHTDDNDDHWKHQHNEHDDEHYHHDALADDAQTAHHNTDEQPIEEHSPTLASTKEADNSAAKS
ncbi:Sec-independent protein translocase protein TatB [Marinagarivorans algicola]|uniref:Sec-independent protein translocase protein TatB n=1 Tax=Marinagarivorans algicola TaxID=1513270 RepID=UPI0009E7953B|nr:Sec-independent protein translocase protein TatB [Marinagarivorans algicola]